MAGRYVYYLHRWTCFSTSSRHSSSTSALIRGVSGRNGGYSSSIYGSAENPDFTVFSVDNGTAFTFDFSGNPPQSFSF